MPRGRRSFALAVCALLLAAAGCTSTDTVKRGYVERGKAYAAAGKYAEAILEYRNALGLDDKFADARVLLAEALAASGDAEGAYREYIRAADLLPNDAEAQKKAATLLFMAGQFQDARTRAEAVLQQNPKDLDAQILYANALVGLRDLSGGVREIEEAVQLDPKNAASYTNLALLKMAQGQREAAEAAFRQAVALDPQSLKARLALAHFQLSVGDPAAAERSLNEASALAPRDALTNRMLAALYVATGRDALAERPLTLVAEVTRSPSARMALAAYYARLKRVKDARAVLEPMTRDPNTYGDALVLLAQITYVEGNGDRAMEMVNEVLGQQPSFAPALKVKAGWLLADGRPVQALERATAAAAAAPRDVGALYLRGVLQAINGQRGAAARTFNDVLRINPRAAAAQVQLAQLSLGEGEPSTAVGIAQEAVANAPGLPEARLVLARALVAQRELARAEEEIRGLLSAYPRTAAVHALQGTVNLLKGDATAARAAFQRAYELNPNSIAALNGLTLVDAQEGHLGAARRRVEERLALQPKRVGLLTLAAKVYVNLNDMGSAERVLKQAIEQAPTNPEAFVLLGEVYRAQNRLEPARVSFDALAERDPENIAARTMAAMLVHAQQKPADAKRRYRQLLDLEPRAAVAANNLAWIYADERQNLDLALQLAERATELLPDYAEALDTLGWVYYRKQLPLLAVEPFERAVTKDPENAVFHYHLGLALVATGDRERGRESLQTALKLRPDLADAKKELDALSR